MQRRRRRRRHRTPPRHRFPAITSPTALARLAPLVDDGLVELERTARRRHVARPPAAAYHRHVLRPLPGHIRRRRHPAPLLAASSRQRGVRMKRHNPIADDGDELHFCSTCAFSAACIEQGYDKSRLGELHVLVEHVGPVRRRRAHFPRRRSLRRHRRGARRHGQDLRERQRRPRAGAGLLPARRGHRPQRDLERALSLQRRRARHGDAVPVFLSRTSRRSPRACPACSSSCSSC